MTVSTKWKYSGRCAQALGLAEFGGIESSHRHSGSDGDAQTQVMLPRVKNDDGVNCARGCRSSLGLRARAARARRPSPSLPSNVTLRPRSHRLERCRALVEDRNRRMLRTRDTMDRAFAQPLDVPALARVAHISPAHFSRQFRATFGETPHRYLQRRRVERAMELLRETDRPVTEICFDVGFNSLGTFTRTFREIVGEPPSAYRARFAGDGAALRVPACWAMAWLRPAG